MSGSTEEENLKNVEHVLLQLKQYGVKPRDKRVFSATQLNIWVTQVYIDATGLHMLDSKVSEVTKAPKLKNI